MYSKWIPWNLISIYIRFNRACRTNDGELYIYAVEELISVLFAANRPNYTRWVMKYHRNLLNMEDSHPGINQVLCNGALSMRRTDKNLSRSAVDLTLEQTINADAASHHTGIVAFNNSDSARQRWMLTRSARSAIVGKLRAKAVLKSPDDVTKSLKPYRFKKYHEELKSLKNGIKSTINPFCVPPKQPLFNIVTGRDVSDNVRDDLVDCQKIGKIWGQEFVDRCFEDENRFDRPIRRRKVKSFTAITTKTMIRGKDEKLLELRGTRDLFGRLLYISI